MFSEENAKCESIQIQILFKNEIPSLLTYSLFMTKAKSPTSLTTLSSICLINELTCNKSTRRNSSRIPNA